MADKIVELAGVIVANYVEGNKLNASELPNLIRSVHAALSTIDAPTTPAVEEDSRLTTAQIRKSIKPDFIVSFLDGKSYKTMKRHLSTHGLTPDSYREKFGLPGDYPIVAPSYSMARSAMAKQIGFGRLGARKKAPVKATRTRTPKS